MQQQLRDQLAEQRRSLVATLEALGRRISAELKDGLSKLPQPPTVEMPAAAPPARWPVAVVGAPRRRTGAGPRRALVARARREPRRGSPDRRPQGAPGCGSRPRAGALGRPAAIAAGPATPGRHRRRVPAVRRAAVRRGAARAAAHDRSERWRRQGFHGRILAESFVGDFCLTGNAYEGFSVADPDLPLAKCALVGNPHDDGLSPAQRQSVAFANFTAGLRQRTNGAIVVEVMNGGRTDPVQYPEQREGMTAGQWNGVATQNNRVEFRVIPGA